MALNDFNLGRTSSGSSDCVGGILALGSGLPSNLAIIGDEFLKSCKSPCGFIVDIVTNFRRVGYSIYDYSHGARVGFAPSTNNS